MCQILIQKEGKILNIVELKPEELRNTCDPEQFDFECTSELEPLGETIGQNRAIRAIEFGVGIKSHGYNIYALGPTGTGKTTFIKKFLEDKAKKLPTPDDWCYVYNFSDSNKPDAIRLPAGKGSELQKDMKKLLEHLKEEIPRALEAENFENERNNILQKYQQERAQKMSKLEKEAAEAGFVLRGSPTGLLLFPASDGKPLSQEQVAQLDPDQKQEIQEKASEFQERISSTMREIREMEKEAREKVHKLEQDTVVFAVGHFIDELKKKYEQFSEVTSYLEHVQEDVVENIRDFTTTKSGNDNKGQQKIPGIPVPISQPSFNRYKVNLIVDNSDTEGAPLVIEHNPTYPNLIGRIDRQVRLGALTTDFTMIKAGAVHKANGGFLIVDVESLLRKFLSWEGLKRVVEDGEVRISEVAQELSLFSTVSVEPEPIPVDLKIILIGSPFIYYILHALDKDFQKQFKVMADFDIQMDRTGENVYQYAKFICARCIDEELLHFHNSAVAKVVEYSSELVGDREKLSTRFIDIVDLVREASYWANQKDKDRVYAEDVKQAIDEKIYRSNRIEKRVQELIEEGTIMVDTEGAVAGQVNGLSVIQLGDYIFGRPSRITARTSLGNDGVVNIEREAKMSGRIHDKGVLILSGYLNGKYAKDKPISLSASICFEQSYSGVEGDSASSTELYALLSSISDIPLKQNIAVTGSVNQRGEIQPIGGVTQKIAGFFDVCKAKGLSDGQGVMIPEKNVKNLMLREDIVEAVEAGKFHIYSVNTIDEGIEVLTGVEAGELQEDGTYPEETVNYMVDARLKEMAEKLKQYRMEKKAGKQEEEETTDETKVREGMIINEINAG
jgi:lon-related putative ATP-dependent protease